MANIKCINNPVQIAEGLSILLENQKLYPLETIDDVVKVVTDELVASQRELTQLTPIQLASRQDKTGMVDFLESFNQSFKEELEFTIEEEKDPARVEILKEALGVDWTQETLPGFALHMDSKIDSINTDLVASNEYLKDLVSNPATAATEGDLEVNEYADLLMNLIRRHFTSSSSPILNTVSPTEISAEFVKFIDFIMFQSMLDTSASGKNLGFSDDPEVLKPKLLKKVKALANVNEDTKSIDVFDRNKNISTQARIGLFSNIIVNNIDSIAEKLFAIPDYNWTADWDHDNLDSDKYLDWISSLLLNNSPRLIEVSKGKYKIDITNPTITSKEMKSLVLTKLANVETNTLSGIRKELSKSNDPIIKSVYVYYFEDNTKGYMLNSNGERNVKHYSLATAVRLAKAEAYGKDSIPKEERKYAGFDTVAADNFKNRLVSTFVSVQSSDRVKMINGRLVYASDKMSTVESAYTTNLISNISDVQSPQFTSNEVSNAITLSKADNGRLNLVVEKEVEIDGKKKSKVLVDLDFNLDQTDKLKFHPDELKGRLVTVRDVKDTNLKNTVEALGILGFDLATPNFLTEYEIQIKDKGQQEASSIYNFAANLAMVSVLNSPILKSNLTGLMHSLTGIEPAQDNEDASTVKTSLLFDPIVYLKSFIGAGAPVTAAVGATFNTNTALDHRTQDGERAAATTASSKIGKVEAAIKNGRDLVLREDTTTIVEGNDFIGEVKDDGTVGDPNFKITKRAIKEGMEIDGRKTYLKDMDTTDRTLALVEMGIASMVRSKNTPLRHTIVQPHLYADKKSIEIFEVSSGSFNLLTASKGKIHFAPLLSKVIDNYQRKYNNLARSVYTQWSKVLSDPRTPHFVTNPALIETILQDFNSKKFNLKKLNEDLQGLGISPEYVQKHGSLINGQSFVIKKKDGKSTFEGIKQSSILSQEIFNSKTKSKSFLKYINKNFVDKVFSKSGKEENVNTHILSKDLKKQLSAALELDKPITDREAVYGYQLMNLLISPQLEELSMGDNSQFKGDITTDFDFSKVQNEFKNEADFKEFQEFLSLDQGQSAQVAAKIKRAATLETNGMLLSLLESDEFGRGLGEFFYTAVINDPLVSGQILTQEFDGLESMDGIRLGLDVTRRQVNSSLGGEASMSSKGEAHKDIYTGNDLEVGAYRLQKMSTMYMTPSFIQNSTLANSLIKRMMTAIPFEEDTEVLIPGSSTPLLVENAWDVLMQIQQNFSAPLTSDLLWQTFQETEAQNPHIRGKYISYITFASAEKTGNTGIDNEGVFTDSKDYEKGDSFQWSTVLSGNKYQKGTIKSVEINDNSEEISELQKNLDDLKSVQILDRPQIKILEEQIAKREAGNGTRLMVLKEVNGEVIPTPIFIDTNGKAVEGVVVEGVPSRIEIESFHKSFNFSKLDYKNQAIVLNAGKDVDYKGGVSKMTQALNSVLFNNSYVSDALNTVKAQGNMMKSNLNKLEEELASRSFQAVQNVSYIKGVKPEDLVEVQQILDDKTKYISKKWYDGKKAKLEKFFSHPEVQRLGYKNFVVKNSENNKIDPDLYEQMKDPNYSFAGSSTNLMFKVFSSYIQNQTIKSRFSGGMMILSPAEEMLKPHDFKGTSMLRADLIKHAIKTDEGLIDLSTVDDAVLNATMAMLNPTDVIVQQIPGNKNIKVITVQEFIDGIVKPTLYEKPEGTTIQGDLIARLLDAKAYLSILPISKYSDRKLKHSETTDANGINIKDTKEYQNYTHFSKEQDYTEALSKDIFDLYKTISESENLPEYEYFKAFESYPMYQKYIKSKESKIAVPNELLATGQTIAKYLWEIDTNLIIVNGKAKLHNPITVNVFDPTNQINSITDILSKDNLAPVIEVLKLAGISLNSAFNLEKVNTARESHTHSTAQENALNKIDLLGIANKNAGIDGITPQKVAKANLITEVRSVVNNEPKYSTSSGEIIMPFMHAKEFGFKAEDTPSLIDILGNYTTEEEALTNAKQFFSKKGKIDFPIYIFDSLPKLEDEMEWEHYKRTLNAYKKELVEAKAMSLSISTALQSPKVELLDIILGKVTELEALYKAKDYDLFTDKILEFKKDANRVIYNHPYTKEIRGKRAESFVKYLKVYYGRIPGTGLQSNGVADIVGFIQDMGNTAFLDTFNMLISGSDFDIDKITTMLRAVDANGLEYSYDAWLDVEDEINTVADEMLKDPKEMSLANLQHIAKTISSDAFEENLATLVSTLESNLISINKQLGEAGKEDNKEQFLSIKDINQKVLNFKKKARHEFERAMQNYILDQMRAITKGTDVQFEAQITVTMDGVADAKNNILNKKLEHSLIPQQKAYNSTSSNPYDLHGLMKIEHENSVGGDGIGMFANAQKNLAVITQSINVKKQQGNKYAGYFKEPINLYIERPGSLEGTVVRTSKNFANSLERTPISSNEDLVLRKVINDFREANPNATILEIYSHINSNELDQDYGIDVRAAWRKKIQHLTANEGWEAIGQFIQSATDNAKVLHLGAIGADENTNSFFSFALIAGFDISDTVEFLANPKIKAISTLYSHFSKEVYTDFDLRVLFGKNIPQEFIEAFSGVSKTNPIATKWPSSLDGVSIKDLNNLLIKKSANNPIYTSFKQLITGEEELRVLNSMIGLDVQHPNSLVDTINKLRTIGNSILTVLRRKNSATLRNKEWARSPASLMYKYTTDPIFRSEINDLFSKNVTFLNGLDVIGDHDAFVQYVGTLGTKITKTSQLSHIPTLYLDSKFSGTKTPDFSDNKSTERLLYGFSVRSYLNEGTEDSKHVVLNTEPDRVYNLTNNSDIKDFLKNFNNDIIDLKFKYRSSLFNLFKWDTDPNIEKDVFTIDKYLSLLIGNNSTPAELAFLKASIDELKMEQATKEQKNFYQNLKLYSLIVEGGLAPKNGIFQFLQTDMPDYNLHLEKINNGEVDITGIQHMDPLTVQLNLKHLAFKEDTSAIKKSTQHNEEILMQEMQDEMAEYDRQMNEFQGINKTNIYEEKENHIDQKAVLYESTQSKRMYYNPITKINTLGHIAVTPTVSRLGRLPLFDMSEDKILNAGFQYGVPLRIGDQDIFVLRSIPSSKSYEYYYIKDQEKFATALNNLEYELNLEKDKESSKTMVNTFINDNIYIESDQALVNNNPNWVFKNNVVRQQKTGEKKWTGFKPLNRNILPKQTNPLDISAVEPMFSEDFNKANKNRFKQDQAKFQRSNKAIITGETKGLGRYIQTLNLVSSSDVNSIKYVPSDIVAVVVEKNLSIPSIVNDAIAAGAAILTMKKDMRAEKPYIGERSLARHLSDKGYEESQDGHWFKDNPYKAQKESIMRMPDDYKAETKRVSKKIFKSIMDRMNKLFPNIEMQVLSTQEILEDPELGETYSKFKGFVYQGIVFLNSDKMTLDTPLHEYGHIYMADLKITNKPLYNQIITESLQHPLAISTKEKYSELTEDELGEEVFVEALGKSSSDLVKSSPLGRRIASVIAFFNDLVAKVFKKDVEVSLNTPLNTIIDRVGHKLVFGSDIVSSLTTEEHNMWMVGLKPSMSYAMMENNLIEQGLIKKICAFKA